MSILLNSSKHAQAPVEMTPMSSRVRWPLSSCSVVLNTTHCLPRHLASSLTVSVLPVPAHSHCAPSAWLGQASTASRKRNHIPILRGRGRSFKRITA